MLILIYVGAIAILFIFVIMMINGPVDSLRDSTVKQLSETRGVSEASSTILLIIISTIGMETLGGMKEI
jgi:NADH:ubiquinone oxidoreductase subunit 6 (subunit J)